MIVGVYQIGIHNLETGKKNMEQVAVMQNMFYNKKISMIFDLKGSLRGRFAAHIRRKNAEGPMDNSNQFAETESDTGRDQREGTRRADDSATLDSEGVKSKQTAPSSGPSTLLDGDFLEFTFGRPMPLTDRAKAVFQMSILNDTLFLSIINVLDYSILVGLDEEKMELVVGIIDFMRQYDILKQMERCVTRSVVVSGFSLCVYTTTESENPYRWSLGAKHLPSSSLLSIRLGSRMQWKGTS